MSRPSRRRAPLRALLFALQSLRLVVVLTVMAAARAFGAPNIPDPSRRNLPAQVVRKR